MLFVNNGRLTLANTIEYVKTNPPYMVTCWGSDRWTCKNIHSLLVLKSGLAEPDAAVFLHEKAIAVNNGGEALATFSNQLNELVTQLCGITEPELS